MLDGRQLALKVLKISLFFAFGENSRNGEMMDTAMYSFYIGIVIREILRSVHGEGSSLTL